MDDASEAIQSYMIVVGFFKKFIKIFQLLSTIYYCFHRFFHFYNTAKEMWRETSFIVMKKGSHH